MLNQPAQQEKHGKRTDMSNAHTIVKNTGWYGLENIISALITVITSIAIARTLGPSKMGYLIYVQWIVQVVGTIGSFGIPATTSKYMAEFLGKGDRGTARVIFFRTLYLQMALASLVTTSLVIWFSYKAEPEYRWAAILIVLSVWPAMVNAIPAMANGAAEQLEKNVPGSIASVVFFLVAICGTIWLKLGVMGVAASFLLMRSVDFLVRMVPTMRRVLTWETAAVHPTGLSRRMTRFAMQSVISLALALIVWNRSEVFLLKILCSDIRQVAFYSVAFSLAERLLIGSGVFGWSTSTTIFAQYGRDDRHLANIASSSFRYLALTSIPLHFVATGLAAPALVLLYGNKYLAGAAAVTLAPLLCMPKAFLTPVQSLLQCSERQNLVIAATVVAGIVDVGIAWYLIPSLGAVGACLANGAAQVIAIGGMWGVVIKLYHVRLPWLQLAKISLISIVAALGAYSVSLRCTPLWGIVLGGTASVLIFFSLLAVMRVLEPEDYERFKLFTKMLPKPLAASLDRCMSLFGRPKLAGATSTNS
jgi:O-antigen/teichoic acid export membrane protein